MMTPYLRMTELLSDYKVRQEWYSNGASLDGLPQNFNSLSFESLAQLWEDEAARSLVERLPNRLLSLMSTKELNSYSHLFLRTAPNVQIDDLTHLTLNFLNFLSIKSNDQPVIIPHFQDILTYEIKSLEIQMNLKTKEKEVFKPSPQVAFFMAGPFLRRILASSENQSFIFSFSDSPKVPYLLVKELTHYQLLDLPQSVFTLLNRANGDNTWQELASTYKDEHELTEEDLNTLEQWHHRLCEKSWFVGDAQ